MYMPKSVIYNAILKKLSKGLQVQISIVNITCLDD